MPTVDKLIVFVRRSIWVAVIGGIVGVATTTVGGLYASLVAVMILLVPLGKPEKADDETPDQANP